VALGKMSGFLTALRREPAREHAMAIALFVIGRAVVHRAGIQFNFVLDWMHQSDPGDLKTRFFETIFYAHAYPPGMSALTGIVLKLGGEHAASLAHAVFYLAGLVLVNSLFYLCRVSGLSYAVALAVSVLLPIVPQSFYLEHLYTYTYLTAALLCLSAALLYRASRRSSFAAWSYFFIACAALGWMRSTYHLVWFLAMVGLAVWFAGPSGRRRALAAALAPAALLLALYVKNLLSFGVFGAMTFGSGNLTTVTVRRLPPETRDAWIREGKLSPFAAVDIYAGPRAYLSYFPTSVNDKWPPSMNRLENPTLGNPNYDHWFFLEVNPMRRADALYYLKERPLDYAGTVIKNLGQLFGPTTEWHPHDKTEQSPHRQHREVLGRYERAYNDVVHGFPFAPIGIYLFFPLGFVWGALQTRALFRAGENERARAALLCFCLFQIAFVTLTSMMFAFGEAARYRYEVEPIIWLIAALAASRGWARVSKSVGRFSRASSPGT
jgi:hypothetical protein